MSEPVEYDCCDCHARVVAFGYERAPEPPRCATCAWIVEFIPPEEREAVRDRLRPPP
jgi:hypothetical protein